MVTVITILHVVVCLFLILVVLLQAGKGGGLGLAFGSNTSAAVFGGRGASNFLERLTAITAALFMLTSMTLAYFSSQSDSARLQRKAQAQKPEVSSKVAEPSKDETKTEAGKGEASNPQANVPASSAPTAPTAPTKSAAPAPAKP